MLFCLLTYIKKLSCHNLYNLLFCFGVWSSWSLKLIFFWMHFQTLYDLLGVEFNHYLKFK